MRDLVHGIRGFCFLASRLERIYVVTFNGSFELIHIECDVNAEDDTGNMASQ